MAIKSSWTSRSLQDIYRIKDTINRSSWSLKALYIQHVFFVPPRASPSSNYQTQANQLFIHLVHRNTVLRDVASLTTLVASLGKLVGGQVALLGDVASLTARVTLDRASLAILGKVVWTAALVTGGGFTRESGGSSWWSRRSRSRPSLRTLSGDVTKFRTSVTLGALRSVRAVALDVADITAGVALLRSSGLWLWASARLVAWLATVVAQSFLLLAVVSNVTGLTAFVTSSWKHFLIFFGE